MYLDSGLVPWEALEMRGLRGAHRGPCSLIAVIFVKEFQDQNPWQCPDRVNKGASWGEYKQVKSRKSSLCSIQQAKVNTATSHNGFINLPKSGKGQREQVSPLTTGSHSTSLNESGLLSHQVPHFLKWWGCCSTTYRQDFPPWGIRIYSIGVNVRAL